LFFSLLYSSTLEVSTVGEGTPPYGVAVAPDGKRAYVTNANSANVSVIDTATNRVVVTIPVGSGPYGVALTPDGKYAYVASRFSNRVSVIDTAANTVASTIGVGNDPVWIAIPPFAPPIANAGLDQTAHMGTLVTLDGSGSSDPNGSLPLSYVWSFVSKPAGSNAALSIPNIVDPTFTPDISGTYVIQLVVTNAAGLSSEPSKVTIGTLNSPPMADAGPDQAVNVIGTVVQLDGSHSYDPDGDPITYQWAIHSKPPGSNASLTGAATAKPNFVADAYGDYSIQLVVTDSHGAASTPAAVTVSSVNVGPVADAGVSQSTIVGQTVTLNGSGSSDANGDPLTYKWSVTSAPSGSQAAISNATAQIASFVPDAPGTFVVQLIVNDGLVDSLPATAQVEAISLQTKVTQDIKNLQKVIADLAPSAFKNPNMQNALLNKLNAVIGSIAAKNYSDALGQLQNDILGKTDGCANT
jgi:YVTN family beta-propeller protein